MLAPQVARDEVRDSARDEENDYRRNEPGPPRPGSAMHANGASALGDLVEFVWRVLVAHG